MSAWTASFKSSWYSSSNTTIVLPFREEALNVKVTFAEPEDFFGLKVVSAVTGFPSISIGFPDS